MKEFKQSVIESLGHYVYCLVDPRDNRIFYIGEGCGNRVFNHAHDALNENLQSLKLDTIRDIIAQGMDVEYYIIRHGMAQDVAFIVESVLIDLLTYEPFNLESILTNIQSGHHQWDCGIKTIDEINTLYDRIMMRSNRRQLFGTQTQSHTRIVEGEPLPKQICYLWPVRRACTLDKRREKAGQSSIQSQIETYKKVANYEMVWDKTLSVREFKKMMAEE